MAYRPTVYVNPDKPIASASSDEFIVKYGFDGELTDEWFNYLSRVEESFVILQKQEEEEKKALATKFAVAELKLNRWDSSDVDYQEVYQTVWLEKLMFVEMSYSIEAIKEAAGKILGNQKKMIASVGLIVSRTGEILKNQTIIITKLDEIKVVVDHIEELSEEILVNTETIITNTEDILANQDKFMTNGITIRDERKGGVGGGSQANNNTLLYVGIGAAVLVVLVIVVKMNKK